MSISSPPGFPETAARRASPPNFRRALWRQLAQWRQLALLVTLVLSGCGPEPAAEEHVRNAVIPWDAPWPGLHKWEPNQWRSYPWEPNPCEPNPWEPNPSKPSSREPSSREPSSREPGFRRLDGSNSFPHHAPVGPLPLSIPRPIEVRLVGKKATRSEHGVPLRLLEPTHGRWRPAGDMAGMDPQDLRVEVRLLPRSLPRWRLIGSSTLVAIKDNTWIEFIQTQADQVLKLKIDCRWNEGLELTITAFFQLSPEASPVPLTMQNRQRAEQYTTLMGQRLMAQLRWLDSRLSNGTGSTKGDPAARLQQLRKPIEQQLRQMEVARLRLEHLDELQRALEQEGRIQVRLVSQATGEEVPLVDARDAPPTTTGRPRSRSPSPPRTP